MQFIGGFNAGQAIRTAQRLQQLNIGSIFDYAREGCKTSNEVQKYCDNLGTLFMSLSSTKVTKTALAIKVSSFYNAEMTMAGTLHAMHRAIEQAQRNGNIRMIMFDAEDHSMTHKEDLVFYKLMKGLRAYYGSNQGTPLRVMKTFQMYRLDGLERLYMYLDRETCNGASRGVQAGVKLVRGAYHDKSLDTVYFTEKLHTDQSYQDAIDAVLTHGPVPCVVATHNDENIEYVKRKLLEEDKYKNQKDYIYFAQLLGMKDAVSGKLARDGYQVMKYVPYGTAGEMLPYLTRRMYENFPVFCEHSSIR